MKARELQQVVCSCVVSLGRLGAQEEQVVVVLEIAFVLVT